MSTTGASDTVHTTLGAEAACGSRAALGSPARTGAPPPPSRPHANVTGAIPIAINARSHAPRATRAAPNAARDAPVLRSARNAHMGPDSRVGGSDGDSPEIGRAHV